MAYKYSRGSTVQGDIKAADDTQRDTLIDFGEDQIDFQTSGSVRLKIENNTITTTVPIHISGSVTEGLRIGKAGSDFREIQFETDGVDTAFIQVDSSEGMVIGCQSVNDEIIFQTTDAGGISEVMRATANSRLGIGTTSPSHKLDVNGDIRIRGNDIRDNSGNPAISFDGSANTTIVNNLTVQDYTFPSSDGSADQVLQTNGNGQLSFVSVSGGGGGGDDFDQSFSSISNATGDVDHNCSSTQTFLHTSISDSFVVNLTNFSLSSGDSTTVTLILVQGNTAHFPSGIKIGGSAQEFSWKSSTYPTPTANAEEVVTFKILNSSGTYLILADVDSYVATVPASPITSGSILYLDASDNSSYNGSGTTWTDLSGQNNHGTITNSPTFSSSTKLFTFDGVNDFVDLPDGFADFSNGITLFFVADFAGTNNSYERLIDLSNGADVDNILFSRNTTTTTLRYDIRDGTNGDGNVTVANGVLDNTVASYAATDDGSTIKLYRNGVLLISSGTTNLPRNVTRTQNFLAKSPWGDGFLEGKMGVAAVYTRALSEDEIAQNHNYYVPIYSL